MACRMHSDDRQPHVRMVNANFPLSVFRSVGLTPTRSPDPESGWLHCRIGTTL